VELKTPLHVTFLTKFRYRKVCYSISITVGGIDSLQRNSNDFKPMALLVIPDNEGAALPDP